MAAKQKPSKKRRPTRAPASSPPQSPNDPLPVTLAQRFADAHEEYRHAKDALTGERSKTNIEAFHRAMGLLNRLEKEMKALQPSAGVMARRR